MTQFTPGTDFGAFRTFAIVDTIDILGRASDGGPAIVGTVDPTIAAPTVDAIVMELSGRGYRRVARTEQPDLGVDASELFHHGAGAVRRVVVHDQERRPGNGAPQLRQQAADVLQAGVVAERADAPDAPRERAEGGADLDAVLV